MKITGEWIESSVTQSVCKALEENGYQALFVGGCVRNALLGEPIHDIDIATDAKPENVLEVFKQKGLKTAPTGIEHGTITVVSERTPFEITTFRKDVETDGRRAVVRFSDNVKDDARRRDFTVNAIYARPDGEVLDPLHGLPDIEARSIRFIEDPETRIREDYLRILRFFRFHASYGDANRGLDPEGLAACARLHSGIETLSRERVGSEMRKLLAARNPTESVTAMAHAGVLDAVIEDANDTALARLIEVESQMDIEPDAMRRLAALGGEDVPERLRLSRKDARVLEVLSREASNKKPASELGYRLGEKRAVDVLALSAAREGGFVQDKDRVAARIGSAVEFPIKSSDLKPFFQGKDLGDQLRKLEDIWIASDFQLSKEQLLRRMS